jgi:phosphonate transport system permease protein
LIDLIKSKTSFLLFLQIILVAICLFSLNSDGDLEFGRRPLFNIIKTFHEMNRPSFLDIWYGPVHYEYKNDSGDVLRVENKREVEVKFVKSIFRSLWITFKIATIGSFLAAILALPLGFLSARNLNFPKILSIPSKFMINFCRSIHTLVFGLFFVGIVGLGPVSGILAIILHSLGTYGKLYAESIETTEMGVVEAIRSVGAHPIQVFFIGVWPSVLPQLISTHLYVWEFNLRDSTVLGLIGAGGIGLLISEAISLFQWARLSTLLLVIIFVVIIFDYLSSYLRKKML